MYAARTFLSRIEPRRPSGRLKTSALSPGREMFSSKPKYSADKTKVHLKMLCNRFQLLTQKKANLAKQQKRQVATLLRDDKEQNARILVEHIIREARPPRPVCRPPPCG